MAGVEAECAHCHIKIKKFPHELLVDGSGHSCNGRHRSTLSVSNWLKSCRTCKKSKPINAFPTYPNGQYKRQCKVCVSKDGCTRQHEKRSVTKTKVFNKNYWIRHKYGIELEDYEEIRLVQNNLCAICGKAETSIHKRYGHSKVRQLCIDHDHDTGKIRGLLCQRCNQGLGLFQENIDNLNKAVEYLRAAKETGNE
jgi:hypothetical protein